MPQNKLEKTIYKTPEEVAEWFAVSKHAVMGWADRGLLPAYIVGGTVRFLVHDVDNFARPRPVRTREVAPPHDQFDAQQAS